ELYTERDGKFVLSGVTGMKTQTDVDNVSEALRKEKEDHKAARDKLKPWGELDAQETLAKLDRIGELEAAAGGTLDEEKLQGLVDARLNQHTAPLQRTIDEMTEANATLTTERDTLHGQIESRKMSDQIGAGASSANVLSAAIGDIQLIAANMMELNENGIAVTKDGIPNVTPGMGVDDFFKEMKQTRTYWWPESEGGGSQGGKHNVNGFSGKNPFTRENWNMTEQGKVHKQDPTLASNLAKAAGTTVGGRMPPAKSA
ncbi:MAG: hypothetical protein ACR2NF_08915, partial [Pirellulales bacterium]